MTGWRTTGWRMTVWRRVWSGLRWAGRLGWRYPKIAVPLAGLLLLLLFLGYDYTRSEIRLVLFSKSERLTPAAGGGWRVSYVPVTADGQPDLEGADQFVNRDATFPRWKRNSGRIDGQLNGLPNGTVIAVRVYGWRSTLFSTFPNIVSVTIVGQIGVEPGPPAGVPGNGS